ncbi:MAG: T9SS type A sorting domain-containing protein [Bacteroidota bacterium]|jgi:hypothetical protein|nr:T9SS type A sorting domain-containing protein [Cytophagales bacterium]MCE2958876.1 T9SS type A sorting domain-containing protein [Flammeovirgaceae bacterium]MCZ8071575.1 T9SS type A sorting domain-containing protein [Cytophagales bacterium]
MRTSILLCLTWMVIIPMVGSGQTSWRGSLSSAWETAGNWTNGVPTSSTDAVIGDANFSGTFQPTVGGAAAACRNLTVGTGGRASTLTINAQTLTVAGTLLIGPNGSFATSGFFPTINITGNFINSGTATIGGLLPAINITGNWTNNGTYSETGFLPIITMQGSNQTISGNSTFSWLVINAGTTVTAVNGFSVSTFFTVNGIFDPGNNQITGSPAVGATGKLFVRASTLAGNFSGTPTFNAQSLVEYTSTSSQTIALLAYGNLLLNGTGSKTFSTGTTSANTFTNNSTATLPSGSTLSLTGNFVNNGTFTPLQHTVNFAGTTTQQISGTSTTSFDNISITNTVNPSVVVQSNQDLRGILTLAANSIFDADGLANTSVFTIVSNADAPTQDGSIATLPTGAQVTGSVRVQRFMALEGRNNTRIYRYISSPVQNASVADLQNEIPVTGPFTGSSTCSGCTTSPSMFTYNESVITDTNGSGANDFNDGYQRFPLSANRETFARGRGYSVFVRGNLLTSARWNLTGPINSGTTNFPVTFTSSGNTANDGWNFVGNPYPSTIDWNAASGWTKTNITATIYMTDNGGAGLRYATWNGTTGTNGGSRNIAMGQGFWVKASAAAPVLTATEAVKLAGTQTTFFRAQSLENIVRISLSDGQSRDEAVIHFRQDAKNEFDEETDAKKLRNEGINLSTFSDDGSKLAINSMGSLNDDKVVAIALEDLKPGSYTLQFSEYESFDQSFTIMLIDRFSNNEVNINTHNTYSFNVTADLRSLQNRFEIRFDNASATNVITSAERQPTISAYPNPAAGNIAIDLERDEPSEVTLINPVGQAVMQFETSQRTIQLDLGSLPAGIYVLCIRTANGVKDLRISKL